MRIGSNPAKKETKIKINSYHRIIVPIYIPNLTDEYFKKGLEVLKICLESLLLTVHQKTRVSIICNGCCKEVEEYIESLYDDDNLIDQFLKSNVNLGKLNALLSAIKSNLEPLITVTDADVMFLPNWQKEVEKIFELMPETGMVSPVPSSKAYSSGFLNSSIYYGLFKGKIKFSEVEDAEGMTNFQKSIGRKVMYNENHLKKYLTIENDKIKAVLGCGHFVATVRAEVFQKSPTEVSHHKIGAGSESRYIDRPNDEAGFLRLATLGNYAYHLGNDVEDWMKLKLNEIKNTKNENYYTNISEPKRLSKFGFLIGKIFYLVLFKKFKKSYFSFKGMKAEY